MAERFVYIGCRANPDRRGKGRGIGVYAVGDDGLWDQLQLYETPDPSFLAMDSRQRWVYAVEGDGTTISAFARDADGRLSPIGKYDVHGINPVDIVISPDDRFAIVSNHVARDGVGANIAAFPIAGDGSLGEPSHVLPLTGEVGPNRFEQTSSKPHHAVFAPDGRTIAVADKGLDEVQFFDFADGRFTWRKADTVRIQWGAGPRNVAYHPLLPRLYLVNEFDSTVITIALDGDHPEAFQRLSSQSGRFTLLHRAAWIEVSRDGRFLYVGNRGQDTIGVFVVDPSRGELTAQAWVPTGGHVPRHFALSADGSHLFVANEFSHDVTRFRLNADGIPMDPAKVLETGSPTCILFAD